MHTVINSDSTRRHKQSTTNQSEGMGFKGWPQIRIAAASVSVTVAIGAARGGLHRVKVNVTQALNQDGMPQPSEFVKGAGNQFTVECNQLLGRVRDNVVQFPLGAPLVLTLPCMDSLGHVQMAAC